MLSLHIKRLAIKIFFIANLFSLFIGCEILPEVSQNVPAENLVFCTTSDFTVGSTSVLTKDASLTMYKDLTPVHSDAISVYNPFTKKIYVLNRYGLDSAQILDPKLNFQTTAEFSFGPGSNPQDMVFFNANKAFVSLYNKPYLLVIEPSTGETIDHIDLSNYADSDGLPEAHSLHLHTINGQTYLYVTLQLLNRNNLFKPTATSLLLIIDPITHVIKNTLTFQHTNPNTKFRVNEVTGHIHISSVGFFGFYYQLDGALETVIPHENPILSTIASPILTESDIGYEIIDFVFTPKMFAIVSDQSFNSFFVEIDINTKSITRTILTVNGQFGFLSYLLFDPAKQKIYIASRDTYNPGIYIFDLIENKLNPNDPLSTGLPPYSMLLVP